MTDHVDAILRQWASERPGLDVSPMAVLGRLSAAARAAEAVQKQTFAAHDLDGASFDVLATLRRSGPPYRLTPGELTRSAMVTSGAITQRLDRLEARGLVERRAADGDGRVVEVWLTGAGRTAVDRALPDHLETGTRLLAGLSPRQRADLERGLRALLASVTAAAGDGAPSARVVPDRGRRGG